MKTFSKQGFFALIIIVSVTHLRLCSWIEQPKGLLVHSLVQAAIVKVCYFTRRSQLTRLCLGELRLQIESTFAIIALWIGSWLLRLRGGLVFWWYDELRRSVEWLLCHNLTSVLDDNGRSAWLHPLFDSLPWVVVVDWQFLDRVEFVSSHRHESVLAVCIQHHVV